MIVDGSPAMMVPVGLSLRSKIRSVPGVTEALDVAELFVELSSVRSDATLAVRLKDDPCAAITCDSMPLKVVDA
ncbi:hypothetical protein MnBA_16910 [Marinobacterium sp. BA1]